MNILITNDDGITSSGIVRLAEAALPWGQVTVVAPETQRSAAAHSITLREPIDLWPHDFPVPGVTALACSGTPADCVRIALSFLDTRFDAVFSGINYGYNIGSDIQYSATVGAALEAARHGILSVAFSEPMMPDHAVTDEYLPRLLALALRTVPVRDEIVNINFPASPCRGTLENRTVSADSLYRDRYKAVSEDASGRMRLVVNGVYNETCEEGTDFRALMDHYVSVGRVRNVGS